ncbi:MAG: hypothetical protein ABIH41_06725 [Nanoarchaeota archaeon]
MAITPIRDLDAQKAASICGQPWTASYKETEEGKRCLQRISEGFSYAQETLLSDKKMVAYERYRDAMHQALNGILSLLKTIKHNRSKNALDDLMFSMGACIGVGYYGLAFMHNHAERMYEKKDDIYSKTVQVAAEISQIADHLRIHVIRQGDQRTALDLSAAKILLLGVREHTNSPHHMLDHYIEHIRRITP